MKMKKGELLTALETTEKFVSKGKADLRICKMIKIDGLNGQVTATDLNHQCVVGVTISDFTQNVEKRKAPMVVPEAPPEFMESIAKEELEALTVKELKENPGASGKKKPELVQSVLQAAAVEAEKAAKAYEDELKAAKEAWDAIPVEHEEVSESLCVEPGPLLKMVKSLKEVEADDTVEIKVENFFEDMYGVISPEYITVGEHFQALKCTSVEEFPREWDEFEGTPFAKIAGITLEWVAAGCTKAKDDVRDHVNNIKFDPQTGGVVATNGNQLQFVKTKLLKKNGDVYLPAKTCSPLAKIAKDKELVMSISQDKTKILVEYDGIEVQVRNASDIGYPDYADLLAQESAHTITVKTKDFQTVLAQAKLMTTLEYKGVICTFNGNVQMRLENPDIGIYEHLDIPIIKGNVKPEASTMMGVDLLQVAVTGLPGEEIVLGVTHNPEPESANPLHVFDGSYHAIVMPMRI